MNELTIVPDWLQELADDIQALHTEAKWEASMILVTAYHTIGARIVTDPNWQKWERGNGEKLSRVTELTNVSERDLRAAIQFYERYPVTSEKLYEVLPEGKNITWHHVRNYLLPGKEPPDAEPCVCPVCGREHTKAK